MPVKDRTDSQLVKLAKKGGENAFKELVERYQGRAYWVAFNMLRNREEATDIAQEAFLRVYRSLDRFDIKRNFYTWLYQIVANLSIDHLRRKSVSKSVSLEAVGDMDGGHVRPGEGAERSELRERVRDMIDKLAPKYKAVVTLRDIEGLSCKEIARIVGTTHATVRWRLHRARLIFRKLWEQEEARRAGLPAEETGENADEMQ
jgi:RNA polymerase sigma-70 factor (ECF subfamily)